MLKDLDDGHRTIVAESCDARRTLSTAPNRQAITTRPELACPGVAAERLGLLRWGGGPGLPIAWLA
jgi:hypothetical protein